MQTNMKYMHANCRDYNTILASIGIQKQDHQTSRSTCLTLNHLSSHFLAYFVASHLILSNFEDMLELFYTDSTYNRQLSYRYSVIVFFFINSVIL